MTRLYLVRHGRASAGWDTDPDPGLDEIGVRQAKQAAARLSAHGPLPIITSPLLRCRQTAAELARLWHVEPRVEPAVGEIPSPEGVAMSDRIALFAFDWLKERGLAVPRDVSVVGFDGVPEAATSLPPLTTVVQPIEAIGRRAVEMILGGDGRPRQEVLPLDLVVRGSTAPPA